MSTPPIAGPPNPGGFFPLLGSGILPHLSLASWNGRGVFANNPAKLAAKVKTIRYLLQKNAMVLLQEVHLDPAEAPAFASLFPGYVVHSSGISGAQAGVAFILDARIAPFCTFSVIEAGYQASILYRDGNVNMLICNCYGKQSSTDLQIQLHALSQHMRAHAASHFLLGGDFNFVEARMTSSRRAPLLAASPLRRCCSLYSRPVSWPLRGCRTFRNGSTPSSTPLVPIRPVWTASISPARLRMRPIWT